MMSPSWILQEAMVEGSMLDDWHVVRGPARWRSRLKFLGEMFELASGMDVNPREKSAVVVKGFSRSSQVYRPGMDIGRQSKISGVLPEFTCFWLEGSVK